MSKIRDGVTIKIRPETREMLRKVGQKGETWDDVFRVLLFVYDRASKVYTDEDWADQVRLDMERQGLA